VIAYYQQVGRAGRAVDRAYGILLVGDEDDEIAEYFITSAFPSPEVFAGILDALAPTEGLSRDELCERVNAAPRAIETALKILEVEGAVGVAAGTKRQVLFRTPNPWQPDIERMARVTALRRAERPLPSGWPPVWACRSIRPSPRPTPRSRKRWRTASGRVGTP
jgi:ATP-dependent DNA helicase RecQ